MDKYTRQCIGCGYCCLKATCAWGNLRMDEKKINSVRCIYLEWSREDSRYRCKLVEQDEDFSQAVGIGEGCTSSLNSWRREKVKYRGQGGEHAK